MGCAKLSLAEKGNIFFASVDGTRVDCGYSLRAGAAGQNSPQQVLDADREEDGGPLGAHGRAERRFRQLSTKQQQQAPVGCYRHTVQRKLREDDAPIGTLGLPHEQLPAPNCLRGVALRRRRRVARTTMSCSRIAPRDRPLMKYIEGSRAKPRERSLALHNGRSARRRAPRRPRLGGPQRVT